LGFATVQRSLARLQPCPVLCDAKEMDNVQQLEPGFYPFADQTHPLEVMAFAEAPDELDAFLKQAAEVAGVSIIRDVPVELVCRS
jgi:hypothetical protein